jgi:hypothetical protein
MSNGTPNAAEEFLKRLNKTTEGDTAIKPYKPPKPVAPAQPAAPAGTVPAATAAPAEPAAEEPEQPDILHRPYSELSTGEALERGVLKGGAELMTIPPRLANWGLSKIAPGTAETLGNLAERIPRMKNIEAIADAPSEGWEETIGSWVPNLMALAMGKGGALGDLARKNWYRFVKPTVRGAKGRMAKNPLFAPTRKAAERAVNAADTAARGAAAGAATGAYDPATGKFDPDQGDVGRGAAYGAAGAFAPGAAQTLLRSPMARYVGSLIPGEALSHYWFGLPMGSGLALGHLANRLGRHSILWGASPWAKGLRRFGLHIVDNAGNIVGVVTPQAAGAVSGKAGEKFGPPVERAAEETGRELWEKFGPGTGAP